MRADAVLPALEPLFRIGAKREIAKTLRTLEDLYWEVLDMLNARRARPISRVRRVKAGV